MRGLNLFSTVAGALLVCATQANDAYKTMSQICQEHGYATEAYTEVTEDGYVLLLQRIPGKADEKVDPENPKPAVLMMHHQDGDMMEWIMNDYENANAFILLEAGYDVWMGNNRGSRFGNTNIDIDESNKKFWDFYQEDMGLYDVPVLVNKVKEVTGLEKISYIGHSEGTTQMFMGASLQPDYWKENINVALALAPVAQMENCPVKVLQDISNHHLGEAEFLITHVLHMYNFFPPLPKADHAVTAFCDIFKPVCDLVIDWLSHWNEVDNPDRVDVYMSNLPSGSSYRTFVYYGQVMKSGRFAKYDYGKRQNKKKYGSELPPLIPLEDISIPIALFSGSVDVLASPGDVAWLSEQLGDKVVFQKEYLFDHFSFVIARDMTYFREDVVGVLDKYNKPAIDSGIELLQ